MVAVLVMFHMTCGFAHPESVVWYSQQPDTGVVLQVDLFMSSTCSHCEHSDLFFLNARNPHIIYPIL